MEWIPTCIDVRARDDAGRWSATTTLCSDDFAAHDAATSDFEGEQPRCPGGIPRDVDGDDSANAEADASRAVCSAATTAAGFAAWHAPLLALLIVLRRARRKPERSGRGATD